jgi:hypothetical protein
MPEPSRTPGENNERDQSDRGKLHAVVDQTAEAARQVGDKTADVVKRTAQTMADAGRRTAETATQAGKTIVGAVKAARRRRRMPRSAPLSSLAIRPLKSLTRAVRRPLRRSVQ